MAKGIIQYPGRTTIRRTVSTVLAIVLFSIPPYLNASPSPPQLDTGKLEQRIFELVNQEREKRDLPPFLPFQALTQTARRHSTAMATKGFFSHTDPQKRGPSDRFREWFPAVFGGIGENIAYVLGAKDEEEMAAQFLLHWMNSPGHKKNILSPKYTHAGVGVARDPGKGSYYATQNFGDLQAQLLGMDPPSPSYGDTVTLKFRYLSPANRSRLSLFVQFPDSKARFELPDGSYYLGTGSFVPEFDEDDDTLFHIDLDLDYGKGTYHILMGLDGSYYPPGFSLTPSP